MTIQFLDKIENIRPFTETEAWALFRVAALGEAIGWTMLILGILIRNLGLLGSGIAVPIAGRVHGMLFVLYFGVLIATYTSLRWSRTKFIVAILAGVPPYGTFVFERWAAHTRQNRLCRVHFRSIVLATVAAKS